MRRGIPRRGLAIGVTYLLLLCVVVILGLTFIPTLVDEVNNFIDAVPQYVQDLTEVAAASASSRPTTTSSSGSVKLRREPISVASSASPGPPSR